MSSIEAGGLHNKKPNAAIAMFGFFLNWLRHDQQSKTDAT
jgi:hypothetical protein